MAATMIADRSSTPDQHLDMQIQRLTALIQFIKLWQGPMPELISRADLTYEIEDNAFQASNIEDEIKKLASPDGIASAEMLDQLLRLSLKQRALAFLHTAILMLNFPEWPLPITASVAELEEQRDALENHRARPR